jgi:hypothetical protein
MPVQAAIPAPSVEARFRAIGCAQYDRISRQQGDSGVVDQRVDSTNSIISSLEQTRGVRRVPGVRPDRIAHPLVVGR